MDEEMKELKSVLRSLVVSSPTEVDVRTLVKDYLNIVGSPLPHAKYGYRDPVTFLKERFDDCFLFQGPSKNPLLILIVPDTLKHINKFVQKQRISSVAKVKGKRRTVADSRVNYTPAQPPVKDLVAKSFEDHKKQLSRCQSTAHVNHTTNPKIPHTTQSVHKPNPSIPEDNKENESREQNASSSALRSFLKKRLPMYNSDHELENSFDDNLNVHTDDDSGRQTASSSSSGCKRFGLAQLKAEITEIIAGYPEGMWCSDLLMIYKERYGRDLNFAKYGYTSLISLVMMVGEEGEVHVLRPNAHDWLLLPHPVPDLRPRPRLLPLSAPRTPALVSADDALPGIEYDADVFPADCIHFLEDIPKLGLSDLSVGSLLEVIVAEVYSPSHFWLQRLGPDYNLALEDLMNDMNAYYTTPEGSSRSLAAGAVRVGHNCTSLYEGDWHRGVIVKIINSDYVKVRHVDYGSVTTVCVRQLRPLLSQWRVFPAQAIRARLAGARPCASGRRWAHAACAHFLNLVVDRQLVAKLVAVDHQDDMIEAFLIDTTTDEDIHISAELVRAGHADPRPDSALTTSECYLYPRFEALECAETPNYAEIHGYLRDGINLEFVEEYRRHVPPLKPPSPPLPDPVPPVSTTTPLPLITRIPLLPQSCELFSPGAAPLPTVEAHSPTPPRPIARTTPKIQPISKDQTPVKVQPCPRRAFPFCSTPSVPMFPSSPPMHRSPIPPNQTYVPRPIPQIPYFPPMFGQPPVYPSYPFVPPEPASYPYPPGFPSYRNVEHSPPPRELERSGNGTVQNEKVQPHQSSKSLSDPTFWFLSKTDSNAAYRFMEEAVSHALTGVTVTQPPLVSMGSYSSRLNSEATEFRLVAAQTQTAAEQCLITFDNGASIRTTYPSLTPIYSNPTTMMMPPPGFERL